MIRQRRSLVEAQAHLEGIDPVMDALMEAHGPCRLPSPRRRDRRFVDLAESIAYQQLNGTAAATIWGRVETACGGVVTPERLLALGEQPLRGAGLSGSKTRSMLDLATHVIDGSLSLDHLGRRSDDDVIAALVPVWGIGRWTAQMFLIFTLGRLDVWPTGDYGVRAGYAAAYALPGHPTEKEMESLGERFTGARSLVAWYCWRAADTQGGRSS